MSYIYHAVPRNMTGTVLYPLNQLRAFDEALYHPHAEKYARRKHLTQERIPLLGNCLWGDVIFCSAVHPSDFRTAFESAGFIRTHPFRTFRFDLATIDQSKLAVLAEMGTDDPKAYEAFDPQRMDDYAVIPDKTREYWRGEHEAGVERPYLYLHIPHILYHGTLDISIATIVEG